MFSKLLRAGLASRAPVMWSFRAAMPEAGILGAVAENVWAARNGALLRRAEAIVVMRN